MMSTLHGILRFKLQAIAFERSANAPLNSALLPRTQVASLRAEATSGVMSGVESCIAVSAVNPKVVRDRTSVGTAVADVAMGNRPINQKRFTAVFANLAYCFLLAVLRLLAVVTLYRAEARRRCLTPYALKGITTKLASVRSAFWVRFKKSSAARLTAERLESLVVGLTDQAAINARVRVEYQGSSVCFSSCVSTRYSNRILFRVSLEGVVLLSQCRDLQSRLRDSVRAAFGLIHRRGLPILTRWECTV